MLTSIFTEEEAAKKERSRLVKEYLDDTTVQNAIGKMTFESVMEEVKQPDTVRRAAQTARALMRNKYTPLWNKIAKEYHSGWTTDDFIMQLKLSLWELDHAAYLTSKALTKAKKDSSAIKQEAGNESEGDAERDGEEREGEEEDREGEEEDREGRGREVQEGDGGGSIEEAEKEDSDGDNRRDGDEDAGAKREENVKQEEGEEDGEGGERLGGGDDDVPTHLNNPNNHNIPDTEMPKDYMPKAFLTFLFCGEACRMVLNSEPLVRIVFFLNKLV